MNTTARRWRAGSAGKWVAVTNAKRRSALNKNAGSLGKRAPALAITISREVNAADGGCKAARFPSDACVVTSWRHQLEAGKHRVGLGQIGERHIVAAIRVTLP